MEATSFFTGELVAKRFQGSGLIFPTNLSWHLRIASLGEDDFSLFNLAKRRQQ